MGRSELDGVAFGAPVRGSERLLLCIVIAVFAISSLAPVAMLDRVSVVLCPFRAVTGLPCPGCGMTHAFVSLGHGDIFAAWRYNALSLPLFVFGWLWLLGHLSGRRMLPALSRKHEAAASFAAMAVTLGFWAYRIIVPSARPF